MRLLVLDTAGRQASGQLLYEALHRIAPSLRARHGDKLLTAGWDAVEYRGRAESWTGKTGDLLLTRGW